MKSNIYTSALGPGALPKAFIAMCLFLFLCFTASAQNASTDKTIKGVVRFSEDNEVAAGVNIYLKGATATGTYSDGNGKFEFPAMLKNGDVLIFSFIGRETIEYVVTTDSTSPLEILMKPDNTTMVEEPLTEGEKSSRTSALVRVFRFRDR